MSRYKQVQRTRILKEVSILNDLKMEAEAGNREAARLYNRIIKIRKRIFSLEFPENGKRNSIDLMLIQLFREEEFFLINHAALIGKPQSYLLSLKINFKTSKTITHENKDEF